MFGLAYLLAFGLYLLISVSVVRWAISHARKNGKSTKRWGWSAALVMYLLVFWDWIPTVVMHQYYCSTEAGFWVNKTLDQWKTENPGVMETLVDNSPYEKYPNWPTEDWRDKKITSINQRIGLLYVNHLSNYEKGELFLNVWQWNTEVVDKQTGEVLAWEVDFSTGNGGYIGGMHSMKFWLQSDGCISSRDYSRRFGEFLKQFRGSKK